MAAHCLWVKKRCRLWAAQLQRVLLCYRRMSTVPWREQRMGSGKKGLCIWYPDTAPSSCTGLAPTPHSLHLLLSDLVSCGSLAGLVGLMQFSIHLLCLLMQNHIISAAVLWLCDFHGRHGLSLRVSRSYQLRPMARCHFWPLVSRVPQHIAGVPLTQDRSDGRHALNPKDGHAFPATLEAC